MIIMTCVENPGECVRKPSRARLSCTRAPAAPLRVKGWALRVDPEHPKLYGDASLAVTAGWEGNMDI